MEFIRQNLTLIVVAGVFLLLAAMLLSANAILGGRIDQGQAERTELIRQLKDLTREPINADMVNAQRQWVESVKTSNQKVLDGSAEWNRRNFDVITVDDSARGQPIRAFPVDPEVYDQSRSRLDLTVGYIRLMGEALASLKPAGTPTEVQVADALPFWINKLKTTEEHAGASEEDEGFRGVARQFARDAVCQEVTRGKMIYADANSLDYAIPQPTSEVTPPLLWRAQVGLWVTQDVLAAIRETNEAVVAEARRSNPDLGLSVSISGVRRLVKLTLVGGSPGGASPQPGAPAAAPTSLTLTGRSTNTLYDTVYYDLIVIMPLKHLERLQQAIMARNYHTILGLTVSWLPPDSSSLFDYGSEPMFQVTIRGELLLLASWVRPLMPVEVLRGLPKGALRQEDSDRLKSQP